MKKDLKNTNKGITLIALVITIIVLLILAGVTIATLTGENGILTKAQTSKTANDKGTVKEKVTLYLGEYRMEKEDPSKKDTLKPVVEWMVDQGYISKVSGQEYYVLSGETKTKDAGDICVIEKETTTEKNYLLNYYDANGTAETLLKFTKNGVILSVASNPATPETPTDDLPEITDWVKALPTGYTEANAKETDLQNGVWFTDAKGNEWTWVVVPRNEVFTSDKSAYLNGSEYNYTKIKEDLVAYLTTPNNFRKSNYDDTWYSGCGLEEEEYNNLYNTMLSSVYRCGGFWISRYEIGRDEDNGDIAVSKQDMKPYNYVTCSESENLAEGLAIESKNASLLFGLQWDLTCKYLENSNYGQSYDTRESSNWGNYYDSSFTFNSDNVEMYYNDNWYYPGSRGDWVDTSYENEEGNWVESGYYEYDIPNDKPSDNSFLLTTGASDTNKAKNIYDFAGNESEWTLEKSSSGDSPCVPRGGYYIYNGYSIPAVYRYNVVTYGSNDYKSFRATLY